MRTFLWLLITVVILKACSKKENPVEAQLLDLNNKYDSALLNRDTAFLSKLYAESFVYTSPEGKLLNKDQQIMSIATSDLQLENGKSEDVQVQFYGDVAVMTGAFLATGSYRGNLVNLHERYTAVWQKRDTSWVLIAEQGNLVRQ